MDVKFNVKYKFKVNGKEYSSLEEMPPDIRDVYEKAVNKDGGIGHGNISSISPGKIVFNGQEYESVDSMPADIRQMYETIMKTVKSGDVATVEKSGFKIGVDTKGFKDERIMNSSDISKPIAPKSFFSPLMLLIAGALLVLFAVLYFMLGVGSR
jgi:hypothetical protein